MNQPAHVVEPNLALPSVDLMGVAFANLTRQTCIDLIIRELEDGRGGWIVTPNVDILRRLVKDPATAKLVSGANLFVADGMPLIWASKLQGTPLPERVAGSDMVGNLCKAAALANKSVYFLGGNPGTAKAAADILCQRFPGLRVACSELPMGLNLEKDLVTRKQIENQLLDARPDIVFVALGFPKQEHVIAALRGVLPGAWWLGVGVSFSFICGEVKRAPRWMQVTGLEWVHRLIQEPRRLAKRYLIDDIPFAISMLFHSLFRRGSKSPNQKQKEPRR